MSELSTICLKLLNCKSSCDVRLQVWFIFHSHWCLKSVSSQGYGSNTQLLPPNITAYSQFLESTESMDAFNVPVTFLIQIHVPVAFVIHALFRYHLSFGLDPNTECQFNQFLPCQASIPPSTAGTSPSSGPPRCNLSPLSHPHR